MNVRTLVLRLMEAPEFIKVLHLLHATPSRPWNAQEVSRPLVALRQAGYWTPAAIWPACSPLS